MLAVLMLVTAMSGLFFGEISQSILFAGTTVASGLAGAVLVASTMQLPAKESYTEALAFLILFWLIVPIVVAIPFVAGGFVESLPRAYFEAVSAFTTTGASTLDPDQIPKTLHVWRSLTQWAGGVAVATFAVHLQTRRIISKIGRRYEGYCGSICHNFLCVFRRFDLRRHTDFRVALFGSDICFNGRLSSARRPA